MKRYIFLIILVGLIGSFFLYQNTAEQKSQRFLNKGNKLFKQGKYIEAILSYQKVLEKGGGGGGLGGTTTSKKIAAEAHYQLATSCLALAQYSSAITEYKKVVNDYKDSPFAEDAQFIVATIFDERLGNSERAKQEFKFYLDNFPNAKYRFEAKRKLFKKNT
ncbi:MAG: tetratricopeptide repeat protein [Elusimicrobiota bacterium]